MAEDAPPVDQRRHRPDPPDERGRSPRRAATITAGMGVVHAVLFLLAFVLLAGAPGPESTNDEIIAYYSSSAGSLPSLVGLYIMPFAVIAFMWFIRGPPDVGGVVGPTREPALLKPAVGQRDPVRGNALGSGRGARVLAANTAFNNGSIDPELARQFPLYGSTVNIVFGVRMAAIFVFTTSNIGRTAGVLPRWFANLGFAVGVFMLLSVTLDQALVLVFPTWW